MSDKQVITEVVLDEKALTLAEEAWRYASQGNGVAAAIRAYLSARTEEGREAAAPSAEPVAWRISPPEDLRLSIGTPVRLRTHGLSNAEVGRGYTQEPLYTAPPSDAIGEAMEVIRPFAHFAKCLEPEQGWSGGDEILLSFDDHRLATISLSCFYAAAAFLAKHGGSDASTAEEERK